MGDFYPEVIEGGLEYPKRMPIEISNGVGAKKAFYSDAIWLSSITNGNLALSGIYYRIPLWNAHFFPGPI